MTKPGGMMIVDWSLYVITDSGMAGGDELFRIVREALRGGAGVVQYREKRASTGAMVREATVLKQICDEAGAVFIVNDRVDVALAVGAHGVHVGQDDMPVAVARRLMGTNRLVGVTVHNEAELRRAEADGADHISIAPCFATSTKPDHQSPLGPGGVAALAAKTRLPVVTIGGINASNAKDVAAAGVDGICVVSAVMMAPDPHEAARELVEMVRAARGPVR